MANHVFQKGGRWSKSAKCTEGIIKTASRLCYCTHAPVPFSVFSVSRSLTRNDALQIFCLTSSQMVRLLWWKTEGDFYIIPGFLGQCLTHSNSQSHSQRIVLSPHCRYSCLVCSHRPVFDTVDVLVVHRKGKRHLEGEILPINLLSFSVNQHSGLKSSLVYSFLGMKWFYGKKNQLKHEIDKRRHQDYVKAEDERQVTGFIFFNQLISQTQKSF